jgi:hypothetical protein
MFRWLFYGSDRDYESIQAATSPCLFICLITCIVTCLGPPKAKRYRSTCCRIGLSLIPKRNGTDANPVQRFCRCDKTPQIVIRPVYVCIGSCNYCSSAGVQGQQMERIQRRCVWVEELRMEFWQHRWRSKISLQERVHLSIGQTLCRLVLLAATPT